jgi:hypothetical protein
VDSVALAAAIGGSVVGLAGILATAWSSWLQRESSRELAGRQHEHERELARGARLFERRAPVYQEMLGQLYVWIAQVNATEPIIEFAGQPEPPDPPSDEEWREMEVQLRTFGSVAVADAYGLLADAMHSFFAQAGSLRTIREQGGAVTEPWEQVHEARITVRENLRALERLVSEELAAL